MDTKPTRIDSTAFHRGIGAYIDRAHAGETVVVTSHGRPRVVVMGAREYEALCEARRELAWMRRAQMTAEPATGGA